MAKSPAPKSGKPANIDQLDEELPAEPPGAAQLPSGPGGGPPDWIPPGGGPPDWNPHPPRPAPDIHDGSTKGRVLSRWQREAAIVDDRSMDQPLVRSPTRNWSQSGNA